MNTKKLLLRFNSRANDWLTELKNIDEDILHIKPNATSWSLAEVYDHVMRVGRSYQITNLRKSITEAAISKKKKNKYGYAVFNLGVRKNIKMKMEEFPQPLVVDFTPIKRDKNELIEDFKAFIKEVNALENILLESTKANKHYHPMFGDITTKEWFALIELHIWQHDKQKQSIKEYISHMKQNE